MSKRAWIIVAVAFVLIAMIISARYASNKSQEILDKFNQVNATLDSSGKFQKSSDTDLKNAVKSQVDYIEFIKAEIIKRAGGVDSITGDLVGGDNINVPTNYLVDEHIGDTLMLRTLKAEKILLGLSDDSSRHEIEVHFEWLHPKGTGFSWSAHTFNHIPAVAAITILNKMEDDCVSCKRIILQRK